MAANAIEAISLHQKYRPPRGLRALLKGEDRQVIYALRDVSFALREGEVLGLVGPNGAGKTTLINIFCTLLVPTGGTARVAGRDVVEESSSIRGLVGVVTSNERSFYWRLSGRENLRFFANLYHVPSHEAERWIDELLERLGLTDRGDTRFDMYSTGMRQRLALARALLHRPKILFFDEPTRGLDPANSAAVLQILEEQIIKTWNPTILLTSHNLREVERLSDQIIIMDRGQILRSGTLADIQREDRLMDAFRLEVAGLSDSLKREIEVMHGVREVLDPGPDTRSPTTIRVSDIDDALSPVVAALVSGNASIIACDHEQTSLEDVFSRLVVSRRKA